MILSIAVCFSTNCMKLAYVTMHTAGYSRTFRSERKLLKSITSPQEVLIYALAYRRVARWNPCFLQSTVWGSTMSSNSTNSVTTCMHADKTQLKVEFSHDQPVHAASAIDCILRCNADVKPWMVSHNLLLNESKTEAIIITAAHNRKWVQPSVDLVIDVCGCSVTLKQRLCHWCCN